MRDSVTKGSTVGSQAVLPQTVKKNAMINPKQTWRPKGNYLDSVNRDNGSYTLKQFEYGNPEEDLKDYAIIDSGCSGSMTGDKDKLSDFKEFKGGYVAFGNDSKGGRILRKRNIKTSCLDFEKVSYVEEASRKDDCIQLGSLKKIIPSGGESLVWLQRQHRSEAVYARKTGHVNFKNYQQERLRTRTVRELLICSNIFGKFEASQMRISVGANLDEQKGLESINRVTRKLYAIQRKRTAAKEVSIVLKEQALHDELVRGKEEQFLLQRGKEHVDSTFTLSSANNLLKRKPKKVSQALADESWFEAMQRRPASIQATRDKKKVWIWMKYLHQLPDIEAIRPSFWHLAFFHGLYWSIRWCSKVLLYMATSTEEGICQTTVQVFEVPAHPTKVSSSLQRFLIYNYCQKDLLGYLKHQPKLGLWYPKDSPFHLEAFSDSDYAGDNHDRRSTSGGCQYLGRRLVSWQCKKQTIVAISSTEAEYVAAASCCAQVLWMQNQLLDYGFNFMNTEIHIDNESTICIVKNPVFHSKTKHIQIRHHFIRDCYEQRLINVVKVHTDDNVADLLTKGFDLARFNFLVVTIGMMNP
ncbi:hypothetical protein Tco_0708551 [Tanacetum coccineum]